MIGWRHIRSVLQLPVMVTVVIPGLILARFRPSQIGGRLPMPWRLVPIAAGLLSIGVGMLLLVQTIVLFARQGQGTLAPWDPPSRLVVRGVYRHVRNPMISGVISILCGESLALGSGALAAWAALFTGVNLLVIKLHEEPLLAARFGADYREYTQHVPRWLPRRRPWYGSWEQADSNTE